MITLVLALRRRWVGRTTPAADATAPAAEAIEDLVAVEPVAPDAAALAAVADPDSVVLVVPGRRRFHDDGCRLPVDRVSERIGLDEALEEGLTPCTACIPVRTASLATGT